MFKLWKLKDEYRNDWNIEIRKIDFYIMYRNFKIAKSKSIFITFKNKTLFKWYNK